MRLIKNFTGWSSISLLPVVSIHNKKLNSHLNQIIDIYSLLLYSVGLLRWIIILVACKLSRDSELLDLKLRGMQCDNNNCIAEGLMKEAVSVSLFPVFIKERNVSHVEHSRFSAACQTKCSSGSVSFFRNSVILWIASTS